jgi:sugar (pentulose or hexulose) kinase
MAHEAPAGAAVAIGIDAGTSGVRAAALDANGRVAATSAVAQPPASLRAPAQWWDGVLACLAQLAAQTPLGQVRVVAVDGTSGTMLGIDAQGRPVGAAIAYHDPCPDPAIVARIARAAPPDSPARGAGSPLARAILLQARPGVARVLHQADWIAGRLCGRFGWSDANNALKTGYDPGRGAWPVWLADTGVDVARLPAPVLAPGSPVAPVTDEMVRLGLPPTALVHAGTTDGCASFLAAGADGIGEAVTALGSTLVVKLVSDRRIDAPEYGIYSHRLGPHWLVGGASNSGGNVLAALFGRDRLAALSAHLQPDRPTGCDLYPLLRPGERFPINDPALKPRLSPRPDDEALYLQAVLEGIAAIEALGYRRLAELGAPALVSVRTVGGGAVNDAWTRIRQARLGVPLLAATSGEACVGAARLALQVAVP